MAASTMTMGTIGQGWDSERQIRACKIVREAEEEHERECPTTCQDNRSKNGHVVVDDARHVVHLGRALVRRCRDQRVADAGGLADGRVCEADERAALEAAIDRLPMSFAEGICNCGITPFLLVKELGGHVDPALMLLATSIDGMYDTDTMLLKSCLPAAHTSAEAAFVHGVFEGCSS
jgi:hypothetical protein